ncbi:hypothetical protein V6N11_004651 [Hibiscus sabdariffa]|uniref:RNase H type-1 domain-containing protein n=1 Tax=Hibiscus sabdariffa TaxID=183260 RepID=A0ABR2SGR2_9ROSI
MRFSIFCWLLWKNRCSALFDTEHYVREGILDKGDRLILECNKVFSYSKVYQPRPGVREMFCKGPARDWVKVNVDASVDTKDNRTAIGGLIRDDSGGWLRGFYRFVGRCSVLLAELWAIYDGLRLAWETGFRQVVVDSDNMEAVSIVNRSSLVLARSALVQSIWILMQQDWLVKVGHVPREENAAAHELAALDRRPDKDGRVLVVPPGAVASIVDREQRRWLGE